MAEIKIKEPGLYFADTCKHSPMKGKKVVIVVTGKDPYLRCRVTTTDLEDFGSGVISFLGNIQKLS